ncbi:MAG: nucleotidyltransferase family protein [Pseudomonadota bacterium]
MNAIILAAGRGERMRPLTDHTPKPLLAVRGKPLIEWHIEALVRAGVTELVINTAWLEAQIVERLGDGSRWGVRIRYSLEGRDHGGALETAGGLKKAMLPVLEAADGPQAFWYVAGDVFVPAFAFAAEAVTRFLASKERMHLWLVPNPPQHPRGDFGIDAQGLATLGADGERCTWSCIALVHRSFVTETLADLPLGSKAPLKPYLDRALAEGRLGAERYNGAWADVGTPDRLAALQQTP